jgi:hypothetical protein
MLSLTAFQCWIDDIMPGIASARDLEPDGVARRIFKGRDYSVEEFTQAIIKREGF